ERGVADDDHLRRSGVGDNLDGDGLTRIRHRRPPTSTGPINIPQARTGRSSAAQAGAVIASSAFASGSWTRKQMAYSTGVTIKHRTTANASPNMRPAAIAPKNGSRSSGIIPRTVVITTMHTGRILVVHPSRMAW